MSFCVAGARDCAPSQKWAKRDGFVMAGVGLLKQAFGYPQLPDPLSLSARPQTRELTCQPPSESKIWALWRHVDWRMSACETTLHPEAMAVQSNVWVHKCCSSAKQLLTTHAWRTRVIKIVWKMVETFLEPITRPLCIAYSAGQELL